MRALACVFTLVAPVLHQPGRDADDVLQNGFGEMLQRDVLLHLHVLVSSDGVQDEDGRHWFTVARQQAAKLRLQKLLSLLETSFLQHHIASVNALFKLKESERIGRG